MEFMKSEPPPAAAIWLPLLGCSCLAALPWCAGWCASRVCCRSWHLVEQGMS